MKLTNEGAKQYEFSMNHALEFFSKAGSLFENRESFYGQEESALGLFQKVWVVDPIIAMKLLFWLRDCRGGAGNRSGARVIYNWLGNTAPEWIEVNIGWIPLVGRWDDLKALFGTKAEKIAAELWANAIKERDVLAAKWAKREYYQIRRALGLKIKPFRKLLASIRKDHIVEHKMCHNLWKEIKYKNVPSVAMARYTNAFSRHDWERFEQYKAELARGKTTINANALFPHDCVRTVVYGDKEIADAQFKALPNYLEGTNERIIVLADSSASMTVAVSGSVRAVDISIGMALYCSAKIGRGNPFYKKFIAFCNEGSFKDWKGMKFSTAVRSRKIFDGAIGSTRIDRALMSILDMAKFFNLRQKQMPTTLLIISDMQFHAATRVKNNVPPVKACLSEFERAGYIPPKIVYWNTAGYAGSPELAYETGIAMVSGFSPTILKSIFAGDDMSPIAIMHRTLEKYKIVNPINQ